VKLEHRFRPSKIGIEELPKNNTSTILLSPPNKFNTIVATRANKRDYPAVKQLRLRAIAAIAPYEANVIANELDCLLVF
jgi:hypothetical protein